MEFHEAQVANIMADHFYILHMVVMRFIRVGFFNVVNSNGKEVL